jgi:hypothetical protein
MGGRVAELLVYGDLSTGAANDLVGNTELARKMVREWGMSDQIGPMAWGSQGQVFLGEDLMHTRDYSEDTSRVIDDEVERILRAQEERATDELRRHRGGLDAVARALLELESISGEDVGRLVDEAFGQPVHANGRKATVQFSVNGNGNGNGHGNGNPGAAAGQGQGGPVPAYHGAPAPQSPPATAGQWGPPPQWPTPPVPPHQWPQQQWTPPAGRSAGAASGNWPPPQAPAPAWSPPGQVGPPTQPGQPGQWSGTPAPAPGTPPPDPAAAPNGDWPPPPGPVPPA